MRQQTIDLVRQRGKIGEIHQPDRAAADLVLVGRADAAPGGADRGDRIGRFPQGVEFTMQGQDQRDVFGDPQIFRADRDALPPQFRYFVEECLRVDHHAVADDRELRRPQHAGGQQRQLVGLAIDDQSVTGIVAALEAHDDVGLLRQPIDNLALPFVTPLGADDDDVGHSQLFPLQLSRRPAKNTAGAARTRGSPPDKGCGLSTQARTACGPRVGYSQPIDIP
jgi:hypothetical protein